MKLTQHRKRQSPSLPLAQSHMAHQPPAHAILPHPFHIKCHLFHTQWCGGQWVRVDETVQGLHEQPRVWSEPCVQVQGYHPT